MRRPSATIVIAAWNQWEFTKRCLETLRPTLGPRDQVVIVDNGSSDETARGLAAYPWATVLTNPTNTGFAPACNQGAAWIPPRGSAGEILVFLNNDTILAGRWLDGLLAPFADPGVGATGPRSNFVSGPQVVENVLYDPASMRQYREFVRHWEAAHRGQTTPIGRLVGFALAVRRSAFEQISGFDEGFEIGGCEDDDLCNRLMAGGWQLLVAHESYVHHIGHATFDGNGLDWFAIQQANAARFAERLGGQTAQRPLLSACMIVKNEEEDLPGCLAALDGAVDEVVVYDTGSTDATVELATKAGAKVVAGYWDDDFARARNASLAECRGEWILHVDADELLEADPAVLRSYLASLTQADAVVVPIDNLIGDGSGATQTHHGARLFRRSRGQWRGRLHEQLVPRPGQPALRPTEAVGIRLLHSGYTDASVARENKMERNLRLAQAEVAHHQTDLAEINLGRCLAGLGRTEEALEHYRVGRRLARAPLEKMNAIQFGLDCLLGLGRLDEALEWVSDLRKVSKRTSVARLYQARILRAQGQPALALEALAGLDIIEDDIGTQQPPETVAFERARILGELERWDEAVAELAAAAQRGYSLSLLPAYVELYRRAGHSLAGLARAIPDDSLATVQRYLVRLDPWAADELAEGLWTRSPGSANLLAAVVRQAPFLGTARALAWSARIRAHGGAEHCPLLARAGLTALPSFERAMAAATALAAFADVAAEQALRSVLANCGAELDAVIELITPLVPRLAEPDSPLLPRRTPTAPGPTATIHRRASIVVALGPDATTSERCLRALAAHTAANLYDIVLVDRHGDGATAALLTRLGGDLSVVSAPGASAAEAYNLGGARAQSAALVFLDGASQPTPGWLPPLLWELSFTPGIGVVGARVVHLAGCILHAGLRFSLDSGADTEVASVVSPFLGLPANYDLANLRSQPRAMRLGALAVTRDRFVGLGGFDTTFTHDYFDADFCLRAGADGLRVIYQPASCLLRDGGGGLSANSPGDTDPAVAELTARWAGRLEADLVLTENGWTTTAAFGAEVVSSSELTLTQG